jgi:hypothetical protein
LHETSKGDRNFLDRIKAIFLVEFQTTNLRRSEDAAGTSPCSKGLMAIRSVVTLNLFCKLSKIFFEISRAPRDISRRNKKGFSPPLLDDSRTIRVWGRTSNKTGIESTIFLNRKTLPSTFASQSLNDRAHIGCGSRRKPMKAVCWMGTGKLERLNVPDPRLAESA